MKSYKSNRVVCRPRPQGIVPVAAVKIAVLSALLSLHVGATEYFVDETRPDDSGPGTSKETAFKTIQAAVSQSDATMVTVYPGRYTRGDAETVDSYGFPVCVYIDKALTLRSVEGRGETFIVGKHAESNGGGGEGGVRCVTASVSGTVIDGFTICDGAGDSTFGGGVNVADNLSVYVNDCTISNCVAVRGGAVCNGRYERCLFVGNKLSGSSSIGSVAMYGYFKNCAFYNNGGECFIYPRGFLNCAFVKNGAKIFSTHSSNRTVYNCVFSGNRTDSNIAAPYYSFSNCVFDVSQDLVGGINKSKCIYNADSQQFIDPAADDWRVCRGSETATAGDAEWFSILNYGGRPFVDYIGDTITATEGVVCAGPCQTVLNPSAQVSISVTRGGGITVTGAKVGANTLKPGRRVDVTAVETNRLFIGWRVNGVMVPSASMAYSYEVTGLEDGDVSIEAVYSDAWYVDAVNGNDVDNDGCTPETPKKTLAAILSVPGLLSGEVVHAARGEYNTGTMSYDETHTVLSRACIPIGVTLLADAGPEQTFITGSDATSDVADEHGLGSNAVRCVQLASNAKISGFTLTGGRTHSASTSGEEGIGSAVLGSSHLNSIVENCTIKGNSSYNATCLLCHLVNCRILDNYAIHRHAVGYNLNLSGCVVDGNTSSYPLDYYYNIWNCTIGPSNSLPALYNRRGVNLADPRIRNTLVLASGIGAVDSDIVATNSVFVAGCGANESYLRACIVTNLAALQVDSNLVPVVGHNVAIDKADVSLYNAEQCGDRDAYGSQRVFNGAMDIGAAEASWLDRYSRDFGGHGVVVTNATPAVVETDAGNVAIHEGRIDLVWPNPQANSMKHVVPVSVTGTGVLTVLLDGETLGSVTRADGDVELAFSSASAVNGLSFVYVPGEDDDGAAVIGVLKRLVGLHVILR